MRIALINTTPNSKFAPVALLKIGAWRKSLGDQCKLFNSALPGAGEFDEIWINTVFTFDIYGALKIAREARNRAGRVLIGGISATLKPEVFEREGFEVHKGLLPEAEAFAPDYTLLDHKPAFSIAHTSRGCVRACGFCMVKILEPEFVNRDNWENDLCDGVKEVKFYDNNWLAKNNDDLAKDAEKIRALVAQGKIKSIDFNQALDARLMTEEKADIIKGLPFSTVRFAFDGLHEDQHLQNAIRIMARRGYKNFTYYALYNFKDTPQDLYYRLRESVNLHNELNCTVVVFPMRYQPILEIDTHRAYVGDNWTEEQKKAFTNILKYSTVTGQVSCNSMQEFEYYYGKDETEFVRLLNYPRITELCKKKKGALRAERLKKREAKNAD